MTTVLTRWGHSCVRFERAGSRLVVDPGTFSDRSVLESADAVLVTHEHTDHVVVEDLMEAIANRSHLEVWAPSVVIDQLIGDGTTGDRLHRANAGESFTAAGFDVLVLGEWHAMIHLDVPRVQNVAYLIDGAVLHPGDSFTPPDAGQSVDVLLAPVSAPWLKIAEVVDYVREVGPRVVVPIHDALLSDVGNALVDRLVSSLGGADTYCRLGVGESLDIG